MARTRLPPLGIRTVERDERLSVVEHLEELRRRIVVSVLALVVTFTVAFVFRTELIHVLTRPLPDREHWSSGTGDLSDPGAGDTASS